MTDAMTGPKTASHKARPTKERLIRAAARLFRIKGYNGVGLTEILTLAEAPKGSLYHHFPNGKSDLAQAAATWSADQMLTVIATSFEPAETFEQGVATVCHKIAKLFDSAEEIGICPVSAALFEGPDDADFQAHAAHLFEGWIRETDHHAQRLGFAPQQARTIAESFYMLLQGGWQLARVRRNSDILRAIPQHLKTPESG